MLMTSKYISPVNWTFLCHCSLRVLYMSKTGPQRIDWPWKKQDRNYCIYIFCSLAPPQCSTCHTDHDTTVKTLAVFWDRFKTDKKISLIVKTNYFILLQIVKGKPHIPPENLKTLIHLHDHQIGQLHLFIFRPCTTPSPAVSPECCCWSFTKYQKAWVHQF